MKQQLIDYTAPIAYNGYSFYLAGVGSKGKCRDTCKELFLRAANAHSHEHFGIVSSKECIDKALSAWELNNLPEFKYEIMESGKGHFLYFEMQEVFSNFLYLDLLIVFLRTALFPDTTEKNLIDKIKNDDSWLGLKDAVKLIQSQKHDRIYSVNAKPEIYNVNVDCRKIGIAVAFRQQILQTLLK